MKVYKVDIVDQTVAAIKCTLRGDTSEFWLPKAHIITTCTPMEGPMAYEVGVPDWLALKHRQLCGDEAFEAAKAKAKSEKSKDQGTLF